ncbi:unnamed protein product [Amoebophrya sp. A120]|nr:unnamed protein product [Amoebophrya sp. A120]|eukprot:GSA120T00005417001.1
MSMAPGAQTYGSRRRAKTSSILSQIEGRILVRSTRTHSLRKHLSHDFRQRTDPKPQWTYKDSELRSTSERKKQLQVRRGDEEDGRIFFAEENAKQSAKTKIVELDPREERRMAISSSVLDVLGPRPREEQMLMPATAAKKRPVSARRMPASPRGAEPKPTWSHILRTALNKQDRPGSPGVVRAVPGHPASNAPSPHRTPRAHGGKKKSPRAGSKSPRGKGSKSPRAGSRSPRGGSKSPHRTPRSPKSPTSPRSPRVMYSFDNYNLPYFMKKRVEVVQVEELPPELQTPF